MSNSLAKLLVPEGATLLEAMRALDANSQAVVLIRNERGRVVGLVTDGDIRRALIAGRSIHDRCLPHVMTRNFRYVAPTTDRAEVLDIMRALSIEQVPILDGKGKFRGIHLLQQMVGAKERGNRAVIMAGGRGTRLLPITNHIPKPMITVAGRPILERIVLHLVGYGIRHIYLAVNYMAESIEDHFGDGSQFGCRIEYLRERKPLGTGGALRLLKEKPKQPLLVMNGDLVTQFNVERLLEFHSRGKYAVTCGLRQHHVEIPFGVADTRGERLVRIREKPTERMLVNAGIYMLSPQALPLVPKDREFPITQLMDLCTRRRMRVGAHLIEDEWVDVGRHSELRRARGLT